MTDPSRSGDAQDVAEALDEDKLGTDPDYRGDEPLDYPPDRPMGSLRQAITPTDEVVGESVVERARREVPDPTAQEQERSAELEDRARRQAADHDAEGDDEPSEEELADALLGEDELFEDGPIGAIVDADADVDGVPALEDDLAEEVGSAGEPLGDEPAEEAALHLTEEPPWHRDDGYVEDA